MPELRFEWDERKNTENKRKHGVSFKEAQTVFFDEHALLIDDPDHSESEERFILLGLSSALRSLVVCHCYRRRGGVIRLISARKANRLEREQYERRWRK
ncbi:MAG: BrnT family toxin [Acidobacteria bacterium]|nr:BrnT family toxin [Acidobacteriota bacterium]